eukprot:6188698-Pleurochrysis_carterae.AAC.3
MTALNSVEASHSTGEQAVNRHRFVGKGFVRLQDTKQSISGAFRDVELVSNVFRPKCWRNHKGKVSDLQLNTTELPRSTSTQVVFSWLPARQTSDKFLSAITALKRYLRRWQYGVKSRLAAKIASRKSNADASRCIPAKQRYNVSERIACKVPQFACSLVVELLALAATTWDPQKHPAHTLCVESYSFDAREPWGGGAYCLAIFAARVGSLATWVLAAARCAGR